jgi:ketosteroid isomerase-like protein
VTTGPDQLEHLVAVEAIRQLVARYAVAVDRRDLDALVALFVPDVAVGPAGTGREALRRSFADSLGAVGITILNVGTHQIDVHHEGRATGTVYCKGEIQDGDRWIHQAIVYDDDYRRLDGRWYFVRRRHRLFYGAPVGVSPLGLGPANWPEHHEGRGTLPESWESWRRFWDRPGGAGATGRSDDPPGEAPA